MFGFGSKRVKKKLINRDPNNQLDFNGMSIGGTERENYSRMSLRSSDIKGPQRGAVARARLNYNRMSRLGPGETAGRLQKNSFAKLKSAGLNTSSSSSKPRSRLNLFK